jgi:hypothetical protein
LTRCLKSKLAGVFKDGRAVLLDVLVEWNAGRRTREYLRQRSLTLLNRSAPQVVAVQLDRTPVVGSCAHYQTIRGASLRSDSPTQSGRQRTGGACDDGSAVSGAGLRAGAATGRGRGAEILVKDFLVGCLQLSDVTRHLLLASGELVQTLPHRRFKRGRKRKRRVTR